MSIGRWWIAVTVLAALVPLPARADIIPSGTSDIVSLLAANQPIPGGSFSFPERVDGSDPGGAVRFLLLSPIVIELLDPTGAISDVLTINSLSGTFASDSTPPGGPPESGESATGLDVQVQSDSDPTAANGTSDIVSFFSAGNVLLSPTLLVEGTPESVSFTFTGLTVPLLEPGTSIVSDTLTIDSFTGSFVSDDDLRAIAHTPGALQFAEAQFTQAPGSLFSVRVASDSTVPEPATLALLGVGLAGLGFSRRRKSN